MYLFSMLHDQSTLFQNMGKSAWYSNCTAILCKMDSPERRCEFAVAFKTKCASNTLNVYHVKIGAACDNVVVSPSESISSTAPTDQTARTSQSGVKESDVSQGGGTKPPTAKKVSSGSVTTPEVSAPDDSEGSSTDITRSSSKDPEV